MTMAGILSKGISLYVADTRAEGANWDYLHGLQEVPELGGTPETIEVTTLADTSKKYIKGLRDFGELSFSFLYGELIQPCDEDGKLLPYDKDKMSMYETVFRYLKRFENADKIVDWKLEFPDGTSFEFSGAVTVIMAGASVNSPLTCTVTITLNSDMEITYPTV
jgi:hypothetical protein